MRWLTVLFVLTLVVTGCGDDGTTSAASGADADQRFPDVLEATATPGTDGAWDFSATISSPYDTPERYADAWRVLGPDGLELGVRELTHDHANEQPFTRSLSGVVVPAGIMSVTIEARDREHGWGGATVEVELAPGAEAAS